MSGISGIRGVLFALFLLAAPALPVAAAAEVPPPRPYLGAATSVVPGAVASPDCANAVLRERQGLPRTFPDCRAYELVSDFPPSQRNNVDVLISGQRVRAAANGGALEFSTLGGTDAALSVGIASEYAAFRDTGSGWITHGISPPQSNLSPLALLFGGEARYVEFTPNLSRGVFVSASPASEEGPNVKELRNLYLREDLPQAGPGRYRLLTDAATPQSASVGEMPLSAAIEPPEIVGASTDLSHVYFESFRDLTADAEGLEEGTRLYESVDGEVNLVSVLPASEGGGPVGAMGGQGRGTYSRRAVSADGSRVVFTAYRSSDLGTARRRGRLYLRDDGGTSNPADDTVSKVNASEKTNGGGPDGRDPAGEQPATFWDASRDLSQIFLTSTEALTDDAPVDEPTAEKLYRYDSHAPSGGRLTLLSVDSNPLDGTTSGVEGVIDTSDDGSYVYFVAANQLVAGLGTEAGPRIFVWHQSQIRQVAPVSADAVAQGLLPGEDWGLKAQRARISADGRRLAFLADATSDPTGASSASGCEASTAAPCHQAYLYSISPSGEERLWCASCRPDGQPGDGYADFDMDGKQGQLARFVTGTQYLNRALSADGRFLFFTSTERLSPFDKNDAADVYELDTASAAVELLSGGDAGTASYFLDASEDGRDVFFATRASLLSSDGNQSIDVYDARVGGGFEEESSSPPAPCDSTAACRPAPGPSPDGFGAVSQMPEPAGKQRQKPRRKQRAKPRKHRHKVKKHRHRGDGHG